MDKEIKLIIIILLVGFSILAAMGVVFVMDTEPQPATLTMEIKHDALIIR